MVPAAAASTILARNTNRVGVLRPRDQAASFWRSSVGKCDNRRSLHGLHPPDKNETPQVIISNAIYETLH